VYRDGEVKASDVAATPGAAPVAMTAILQSKEYESLAKNPAFLALLSDRSFLEVVHNANFQTLMQEATFRGLLASSHSRTSAESETAALVEAMQAEVRAGTMTQVSQDALNRLRNDSAFAGVLHNTSFRGLVADKAFAGLVTSAAFQSALASSMASLRPHD